MLENDYYINSWYNRIYNAFMNIYIQDLTGLVMWNIKVQNSLIYKYYFKINALKKLTTFRKQKMS